MAQSKLERLHYQNALEAVAERFHASPQLLQRLNGGAAIAQAGARLMVPNVEPFELPQPPAPEARGRGRNAADQQAAGRAAGYLHTDRGNLDGLPTRSSRRALDQLL